MSENEIFVSVGRRKTSVARARLAKGSGKLTVNDKPLEEYCYTDQLSMLALRPLVCTATRNSVDAALNVKGGGPVGQAGAISHALARALQKMDESLRPVLKQNGLITRDPRAKERKKSGQPGARKRFQFSKR